MARARFVPDPSFEKHILAETDLLTDAAKQIATAANRNTTRIMPAKSQAIEVQGHGDDVAVVNTDHGGHLDEWGSAKNPARAPLRRAVRALGLRFTED